MWSSELHLSLPYESTYDKNSLFLLTWIILDHPDVRLELFYPSEDFFILQKIEIFEVCSSLTKKQSRKISKISAFSQNILQISAPKTHKNAKLKKCFKVLKKYFFALL